ncbi:MAG: hypothetical protein AAF551_06105 [Bacteroidota bacterium]
MMTPNAIQTFSYRLFVQFFLITVLIAQVSAQTPTNNPGPEEMQNVMWVKWYGPINGNSEHNTQVSTTDWIASIMAFDATNGDIQEKNSGDIMDMRLWDKGGFWHLQPDFRSHNTAEQWYVGVLFIRKSFANGNITANTAGDLITKGNFYAKDLLAVGEDQFISSTGSFVLSNTGGPIRLWSKSDALVVDAPGITAESDGNFQIKDEEGLDLWYSNDGSNGGLSVRSDYIETLAGWKLDVKGGLEANSVATFNEAIDLNGVSTFTNNAIFDGGTPMFNVASQFNAPLIVEATISAQNKITNEAGELLIQDEKVVADVADLVVDATNQIYLNGPIQHNTQPLTINDDVEVIGSLELIEAATSKGKIQSYENGLKVTTAETFKIDGRTAIDQLFVSQTIETKNIDVKPTEVNWPDYVLKNAYELRPLEEVKSFVEKHHHLPEVPSEQVIKEEGYNMTEMDAILLKKIEELTLYIIELEQKIAEKDQH